MADLKKKRRKPVLLITVASLAAVFVLYLEFFAPPIIDPPEFFSDGGLQVQYLTARSPFSRRVVFRLATVDLLSGPTSYDFRGRDVVIGRDTLKSDCAILCNHEVNVGLTDTFDLLWDQRGYIKHLQERPIGGGLQSMLNHVAEETGDLHLARLTWPRVSSGHGMD